MRLYGRYDIAGVAATDDGRSVRVRTLTLLRYEVHDVPEADLDLGRKQAGRTTMFDVNNPWPSFVVNAPWQSVRVKGRRWPLIRDLQGESKPAEPKHRRLS